MPQTKFLLILFIIVIFSIGFSSGRWSSEDTCDLADLTDTSLHAASNTGPDESVQTAHTVNTSRSTTITHKNSLAIPTVTTQEGQTLEDNPCNQACIRQRLNELFRQQNDKELGDTDRYSAYTEQITRHLIEDPTLFSEYKRNLIDQIAPSSINDTHKEETLLGIAHGLPQELRARLAWEMVQSYETPQTGHIALELLPEDTQLRVDVARIAMQSILQDGSETSLSLLQHIVNLGSDLSESTVAVDLEYYHKTLRDPMKRNASLSLLAQMNPDSQALKDSLAANSDSAPQDVFSALNAIAAVSQIQTTQASDNDQSTSRLISANRERIHALANDTAAPLYVRIEAMQLLMTLDHTLANQ